MNEIVLRELDGDTITSLAERAAGNDRLIEQGIADVLRQAMNRTGQTSDRWNEAARLAARAHEIAAMTPVGVEQTNSVNLIAEDRAR